MSGNIAGNSNLQIINAITQFVGGTQAVWNSVTVPVPQGLVVYATDTTVVKIGDGITLYANLPVLFTLSSITSLTETINGLTANNTAALADFTTLSAEYTALSGIVSALQTTVAGLGGGNLSSEVATLMSEYTTLSGDYTALSAALTALQTAVTNLQNTTATATSVATLISEYNTLNSEYTALNATVTPIPGEITTINNEITALQTSVTTLQGTVFTGFATGGSTTNVNIAPSRSVGVTYTNSRNRPISLFIAFHTVTTSTPCVVINGVNQYTLDGFNIGGIIIFPGQTYELVDLGGFNGYLILTTWIEI